MNRQKGFTLFETMMVLAVASVTVAAVSFGFVEYRRQAAVADAVELVGAVQRAAEQLDPSLPVNVDQLTGALDVRFRAPGSKDDPSNLTGFRGGRASVLARAAGGIEVRLSGVDPAACGEIVSRLWPMVDGISAGWDGSKGGLEALKQPALGNDQPSPPAAALRRGCVQGAAERDMVIAMVNGFPGVVSAGADDTVKPGDPVVIDPVIIDPVPPPDTGKK
ncbi:hypothetical protein [Dolichospermum phage Dfl-JY45]